MSATPITLIGLGPMGQAMARGLLAAGHPVTVWNRTPSRAESLVADGARLATAPSEAVAASDLIILSLTDYQAMWDVLDDPTVSLAGRTLANLSSDTPDTTREAAAWARSRGASFLTGGVMVPPHMVGTDLSYVYYSGDAAAFEVHRRTLARIGEPRFLGEDPARAQLMYQAHLDVFLTTLSGFAHATALVGTAGITAEAFLPEVMDLFRAIPDMIAADGVEALGARIDAGEHSDQTSSNIMMGATADHIHAASQSAGIDTALPRAVQAHYHRAIADGHGASGWTRIIDGIRTPRANA
jgi:3-hydroxyisobutyrate dehydrogenase-like beta-hydroxyacid dehydrogenase